MTTTEAEIASHLAKYEPATSKLGKALRARLRARLPGLNEIVYFYENQHTFLISYSPTERGYEGVCSLALDRRGVKLGFGQGAQLSRADPARLLEGSGKTVRHVVLRAAADIDRPEIEALIAAALELANVRLDARARNTVISKTESQKARARRAKKSPSRRAP